MKHELAKALGLKGVCMRCDTPTDGQSAVIINDKRITVCAPCARLIADKLSKYKEDKPS